MQHLRPKPHIVCIVGLCGVGKSEATQLARALENFHVVHFGGVVIAETQDRGLEVNPANEALVREELRRKFGMEVMADRMIPEIRNALAAGSDVLVDGLYSYSEYILLRELFPEQVKVIAIHAGKLKRAARLAERSVRPLTYEQMESRDKLEVQTLEKAQPIALADFHIVNEGSIAELQSRIKIIIGQIGVGDCSDGELEDNAVRSH